MNIKELKELFSTGDYICLHKAFVEKEQNSRWEQVLSPTFDDVSSSYRLISVEPQEQELDIQNERIKDLERALLYTRSIYYKDIVEPQEAVINKINNLFRELKIG